MWNNVTTIKSAGIALSLISTMFVANTLFRINSPVVEAEPVVIAETEATEATVPETTVIPMVKLVPAETVVPETTVPETTEPPIDEEELYWMAHLIFAEAGADYCSDQLQQYVGSVVLNRVNSDLFPDNIHDVIFAKGQYSCTWSGGIYCEPNERAWAVAEDLLRNGSVLPSNVVFQAEFKQGSGVYEKVQNTYFCYVDE